MQTDKSTKANKSNKSKKSPDTVADTVAEKPSADALRSDRYVANNANSVYAGASTTATSSTTRNPFKTRSFTNITDRLDDKMRALFKQYGEKPFSSLQHDKSALERLAFAGVLLPTTDGDTDYRCAPFTAKLLKTFAPIAAGAKCGIVDLTDAIKRAKAS